MITHLVSRKRVLGAIAAILGGLAITAVVPSTASAGWPVAQPYGGWGGYGGYGPYGPYRRAPIQVYRVPPPRPYYGGYLPRTYVAPPRVYVPAPRVYVPPARVYYAPPVGYYPPLI